MVVSKSLVRGVLLKAAIVMLNAVAGVTACATVITPIPLGSDPKTLVGEIDRCKRTLRFRTASLNDHSIANALKRASQRGVHVILRINDTTATSAWLRQQTPKSAVRIEASGRDHAASAGLSVAVFDEKWSWCGPFEINKETLGRPFGGDTVVRNVASWMSSCDASMWKRMTRRK